MFAAKDLVLLTTTIICILYFRKGGSQGILAYLIILSTSALFGFARGILAEEIIIPICLVLCYREQLYKEGRLLWYILIITIYSYFKGNKVFEFGEYDDVMVPGFAILSFRKLIIQDAHRLLLALWLFSQCKIINLIIQTGPSAFALVDTNDVSNRMIQTTTIYGDSGFVDPNYLALVAGLGFIISLLIIKYTPDFNIKVSNTWLLNKYLLYIILIFDLFFSIRGLSRGLMIAITGSVIVMIYYCRVKLRYVILLSIIGIIIYLFADKIPILNGYIERFNLDDGGNGRILIWASMLDIMINDGPFVIIFGEGLNYHWWLFDNQVAMGELLSSHNSLMTLFLATGCTGIAIILSISIKAYRQYNRMPNRENVCKATILTYILLSCLSIEPLHFCWAWIALAIGCSGVYIKKCIINDQNYVRY